MSSNTNPLAATAAGEFTSLTRPPVSHFITSNIPAPTQAYVPPDGFFRVNILNTFVNAAVIIDIRTLRGEDGTITLSQDTFFPSSGGSVNTFFIPAVEGFVLSASARTESLGLRRGQTFISIQLGSGSQQDFHLQQVLVQDYIAQGFAAGWPGGTIKLPTDGPGLIRQSPGGNPALGNDFLDVVPTNRRWKLLCIFMNFVTSATVANRVVQIVIDDGSNFLYQVAAFGLVTANSNILITLMPGVGQPALNNNVQTLPLPEGMILNSGFRIRSVTPGLQASDFYNQVTYHVEEWVEP